MLEPLPIHWPPDYRAHFAWRQRQLAWLRQDPDRVRGALEYYANHPIEFIDHWGVTYDPRNVAAGLPTHIPFVLFPRQRELIEFLQDCQRDSEDGLIEKARDMGATWACCGYSVHQWRFEPGSAIGWGSRLVDLVDRIGIIDSIFEKIRVFIRWLPPEFWPRGFDPNLHMPYLRIINPENGATISGEGGDNMGRGGRKTIYFKDESAHYVHPEAVEAALTSNAAVQIDISSVHGLGNVFQRRRDAGADWSPGAKLERGQTRVFVLDWRDHPAKTQEWYDRERRAKVNAGLGHIWAQEVDRNYAASVVGTIIPAEWVRAAIDAHRVLGFGDDGGWCAALDVADGGQDTNAFSMRKGVVLRHVEEWVAPDPAVTARRAIGICAPYCNGAPGNPHTALELQYDCIGIGASVKAEGNRLDEEDLLPAGLRLVPWNAGAGPLDPEGRVIPKDRDSPLNDDFYANLKAQGWWQLRGRFERTWRAVVIREIRELILSGQNPARLSSLQLMLQGSLEEDIMALMNYTWDPEDLISISSADIPMATLRKLEKELSQPTAGHSSKLKLLVNKTPEGTKSPNLGDCVVMNYWPVPAKKPIHVTAAVLARAGMPELMR